MIKTLFVAAAMSALAISGAQAADVEPSADFDWSGVYLGLHAGYGWSDADGLYDGGGNPGPFEFGADLEGGLFGAQIGYNAQIDSIVLGVEGDVSATDIDYDTTLTGDVFTTDVGLSTKLLASIRARLGWAFGNTLVYGTVGLGYAEYEFSAEQNPKVDFGPNGSIEEDDWNLVYGGGIEHAIDNVRVRLEYLHYDTSADHDFSNEELVDTNIGDFVDWEGVDVVRLGVSFGFNGF